MVDINSLPSIAEIMEEILTYTASVDPDLRASLRDGLSYDQIEEKSRDFGLEIPREVKDLYAWHDGMHAENREDHQLLYYHYFLPLDEALELCEHFEEVEFFRYSEDLLGNKILPLFEYECEYYAARCNSEKQDRAPIYFVYHGEKVVYDSLTTMLMSILECYRIGAYILTPNGDEPFIEDEQLVAQTKLNWNPVRSSIFNRLNRPYNHP